MTGRRNPISLPDEAATAAFGRRLAAALIPGDVVFLVGGLGAGKTALARAVVRALTGEADEVPSPTYTLVQTYDAGAFEIWHCDLYRLSSPSEAVELGLEDAFAEAVVLVEWPDRLGDRAPADRLEIQLEPAGGGRVARLAGHGRWAARVDGV